MAVTNLSRVISETFVKTLTRVGTSSSSSSTQAGGATSFGQQQEISLSAGLRNGARDFSASVQLLNNGISVINVARDANEKLLELVSQMDKTVQDAARGGIGPSRAKRLRAEFGEAVRKFEKLLQSTAGQELDVFNPDDLSSVLSRAGLELEQVDELAGAFRSLTALNEAKVDSSGAVTSTATLIPKDDFQRAVTQSIVDLDDPLAVDDVSGFGGVRSKMRALRRVLEGNVSALDKTASVVGKNLELVRVVGLAMLDLSSSITGSSTAASVAEELQSKIRQGAPLLLSQSHNLQAIAVAGLTAIRSQAK